MISIGNAASQASEFFNHLWSELSEIIHYSPAIKVISAGAVTGGATTMGAVSVKAVTWFQISGLCLTATSIMVAIGSLYLGYLNYKERVRENNLKRKDVK